MRAGAATTAVSSIESQARSIDSTLRRLTDLSDRLNGEWEVEIREAVAKGKASLSHHHAVSKHHRGPSPSRKESSSAVQNLAEGHLEDALVKTVKTLETIDTEVKEYIYQVTDALRECSDLIRCQSSSISQVRDFTESIKREEYYFSDEITWLKEENGQLKDDLHQLDSENHKLTKSRDELSKLIQSHDKLHRENHCLHQRVHDLSQENCRLVQDCESLAYETSDLKTSIEKMTACEFDKSARHQTDIELQIREATNVQVS